MAHRWIERKQSFENGGLMKKQFIATLGALVVLATSTAASSDCNDGKDRRVRVTNDTSFTLTELYGSNVGADDWEEDVLGNRVLKSGQSLTVNFDDGTCYCHFDFKAVFNDGTSTIKRNYDVCNGTGWRIHD
jgi:hypothetical protein